ncbi:MAG TPA: hypothetical protein VFD15_04085 [Clostridia bacterium]|nr:hypothetical protein [Clostridia bacterium]
MGKLKRINIFTGNLGSGKTEIAINYALKLLYNDKECSLVDLDIVNPYFRSRLARSRLEEKGLRVICPDEKIAFSDLPALSPLIQSVFDSDDACSVLDVGGDDVGATVLGRFKPFLPEGSYELFFIVNAFRPYTRDVKGVTRILRSIEQASRLKVTTLISNGHLGRLTEERNIREGLALTEEVGDSLGLPVAFVAVGREMIGDTESKINGVPVFPLDFFMVPPW